MKIATYIKTIIILLLTFLLGAHPPGRRLSAAILRPIIESRKEFLLWMFERAAKKNKRNTKYQVWQQHNHPIELTTNEMIDQRLDYIHHNPVEAGFVQDAACWHWGSARDYMKNEKGYVKLYFV